MIRFGAGDEFNVFVGDRYELTSATRSYEPVSIAVNPVTNIVYTVHKTTGDVTAQDVSVDQPYPPLLCPDGSGGLKPNPAPTDPPPGPCINIPDIATAVAVNPVTNKIYAISTSPSGQISVINGFGQTNPHAFTSVTPANIGSTEQAITIAVNPVSNKVYAVFANHVVILDGTNNSTTTLDIANGVAVGIDALRNKIYIPRSTGQLTVIDGATNAATSVTIPTGAKAVAVNPITNTIYVLTDSGVVPVDGTGSAVAQPLNTAVTPLSGNQTSGTGTLTLTATNTSRTRRRRPRARSRTRVACTTRSTRWTAPGSAPRAPVRTSRISRTSLPARTPSTPSPPTASMPRRSTPT
jgi:DNA-binding beta-propeller fold protein YncE